MLIMETIGKIRRLYYVQGKGYKTIARELRLSKIFLSLSSIGKFFHLISKQLSSFSQRCIRQVSIALCCGCLSVSQ